MIIGSHNSWSYLRPRQWYLRPFAWMARCQRIDVRQQYIRGVRCFDLRLLVDNSNVELAHGLMRYDYTREQILADLEWLDKQGDCYVRVINEARTQSQHRASRMMFPLSCDMLVERFIHTQFWGGRNLYDWSIDYQFEGTEPTCCERYASVSTPKLIDDWWPWLYARLHNRRIRREGTDRNILLIDFVDIE